jgi:hypothetical protein
VQNATPRTILLDAVRFEAPPHFAATDLSTAASSSSAVTTATPAGPLSGPAHHAKGTRSPHPPTPKVPPMSMLTTGGPGFGPGSFSGPCPCTDPARSVSQSGGGRRRFSSRPRTVGSTCSSSSRCHSRALKVRRVLSSGPPPPKRLCMHGCVCFACLFGVSVYAASSALLLN